MGSYSSLKVALAVAAALLASGTTFAWAGGIVGGHRADHIGTFEPVSQHLAPAGTTPKVAAGAHDPETTIATVTTTGNHPEDDPTAAGDDNGRSNDD